MAQLLDVEIMDFKRGMRHLALLVWFHGLEEKGMMVGILQAPVNVEEADGGCLAAVDRIRRSKGQRSGIPVVHGVVTALCVSDALMAPTMDRGRPGLEVLELALPRLVVFLIDRQ